MRYFFLFYVLQFLLHNPLLALLAVGVAFYFSEARYSGRYFNPGAFFTTRTEAQKLRKLLAINPHDVGAHNDLGRILVGEGKLEEALGHMQTAIRRMEESAETNYYLGVCLLGLGRSEEGQASIQQALELNPGFLYGEPEVTLARHHHEGGRPAEAAEHAARAVKLNTSSVEGWYLLGAAREALGETAEAARAYESAREAYEHLPHYLRLAGRKWAKRARKASKRL